MKILSINARLMLAASLVLALFLGLTGIALDRAYRSSIEQALKDQLQTQIYALLAAAENDVAGRPRMPEVLPEPRLNRPESGLYAEVSALDDDYQWRSISLLGQNLALSAKVEPGETRFQVIADKEQAPVYLLQYGVAWETNTGYRRFVFSVAASWAPYALQKQDFRLTLRRWLIGLALFLLAAQLLVLRWGLRPLQQVANEVRSVEQGHASGLSGRYPHELAGLTSNLNSLLAHARAREARYRHSLDDLAHSMKTPLAVLRNFSESKNSLGTELKSVLDEQVSRMDDIVQYQLQRATLSGRSVLANQVPAEALLQRIISSLDKVYEEKSVAHQLEVTPGAQFQGDDGDFMELAGNLLENAWKYCTGQVQVYCGESAGEFRLTVEDDGPGISAEQRTRVLERGRRADQTLPGQGIGLSMVHDIVSAYQGELTFSDSLLGGALVIIVIKNIK